MKKEYWNLDNRPHTKLKLEIYRKYIDSWCNIFMKQPYYNEVYIVDCFAGVGQYLEKNNFVDGSPLIAVKAAEKFQDKFIRQENKNKSAFKINCIFIENDKSNAKKLKTLLLPYDEKIKYKICRNYW